LKIIKIKDLLAFGNSIVEIMIGRHEELKDKEMNLHNHAQGLNND